MDYEFTYYHTHLVAYARFNVFGTIACVWVLTILFIGAGLILAPIFDGIFGLSFIFGLSIELEFMVFERPDKKKPESRTFFRQLLVILAYTVIISLIYVVIPSIRSSWLSRLGCIGCTLIAQKWLLGRYQSLMREAHLCHVFRFTGDRLEKFTGDLKVFDAPLRSIARVSFVDEWVVTGEGGANTFNLYFHNEWGKIEDMTLTWTKITPATADFIFFVQKACQERGIPFTQTVTCGKRNDPINDLHVYFSPEKKKRDRVETCFGGLIACNIFLVPITIAMFTTRNLALIGLGILLAVAFWVLLPGICVNYWKKYRKMMKG